MSKKIHDNDIEQIKQVFEVTFPKFNLDKIQICVGNPYEISSSRNRYTIYNVDKTTKKVTESIGYYELDKDVKVLDDQQDFNVRELGEEPITINPEFVSKMSKKSKVAVVTKPKSKVETSEPVVPPSDLSQLKDIDDEQILSEYFDNNNKLSKDKIVSTYLENFAKPRKWVQEIGMSITALYLDVYVIVVHNNRPYLQDKKPVVADKDDGPFINMNMTMYPFNEEMEYNKERKYVLVLWDPGQHYRLLEHKGQVQFEANELPSKILDRTVRSKPLTPTTQVLVGHELDPSVKGVDNSLELTVITTTGGGDCFFDSMYRATAKSIDIHASKDNFLSEVHALRVAMAEKQKETPNPVISEKIKQLYYLFSQKNMDEIRNKFYAKMGRVPIEGDRDNEIFYNGYSAIFGNKKYDEKDFDHDETESIMMNYLTLLYEFFPSVSKEDQEKFNDVYISLFGVGKEFNIRNSIEQQRSEIQKVMNPKPEPVLEVVSETKEEPVKASEPVSEPKPEPVKAVEPVSEPKPEPVKAVEPLINPIETVNLESKETSLDVKKEIQDILQIYASSNSVNEKKISLKKYNKKDLSDAWALISKDNPSLRHPPKKNIDDYVNCLSKDPDHTCNAAERGSKSKKTSGGSKFTRRKKI
jgi:hypothetical protein